MSERIAISGQPSIVRKIDHKLTVCGTADDCLNCDFCDLLIFVICGIASGTRSYRRREDREWNSLLPLPLLIFLLKKQQKLEAFLC